MAERIRMVQPLLLLSCLQGLMAMSCESLQTDSIYSLIPELGWQAKWMPLHCALIQLSAPIGANLEFAGRMLSVLAATALFIPVRALALRVAPRTRDVQVVCVLAFTPLILRYAGLVLNDLLFCLFLMNAMASFVLHGRWFPLWFVLGILTRPEGWVLVPLLLVWHAYARGGLWISALGVMLAVAWMWGRTGSFSLGQEWVGGALSLNVGQWCLHAMATLGLVLVMGWPALSPLMDSRIRGNDGSRYETAFIVMFAMFLLMWILPSLTTTWSGRRALPLLILLAPWTVLGLQRSRVLLGLWMVVSLSGCTAVWWGLQKEHADLKAACQFVKGGNPTGLVYVDDLRRCQWWLRPIPADRVRVWRGEKLQDQDCLILWSRRHELPTLDQKFLASTRSLNLFGDGIWWRGGEAVSQEPPRLEEWLQWQEFKSAVY